MRKRKYRKTEKWQAAVYRQRIDTAERNIEIYKLLQPPLLPGTIEGMKKVYKVSDKRLYQIRDKVQKMIDNNEIDIELFNN